MDLKQIDYLSSFVDVKVFNPSVEEVFTSTAFLRLWLFLYTYGERFALNEGFHETVEVTNEGHCITHSQHMVSILKKQKEETHDSRYQPLYVEGVTNLDPLILHAWWGFETAQHHWAFEQTRKVELGIIQHLWYQGVAFDPDFVNWLQSTQYKNRKVDTLPYLKNYGACALTYKPLLEGKLSDYPLQLDKEPEAYEALIQFVHSWENVNTVYNKLYLEEDM